MRRRRSLFELDQAGLPLEDLPVLVPPVVQEGPQQLLLFESRVLLLGELEQALAEADYARAIEVRESLKQEYGPGAVPPGLSYLDVVGEDFWARPLHIDERLSGWEIIEAEHEHGSFRWKTARRGFFRRLLDLHTVDDLGRATPDGLLPHVVNTLYELARGTEARRLVRDSLVQGRSLNPLDFEDQRLSEILSEDLSAEWLASLGAIRRLWPRPRPTPEEMKEFEDAIGRPDPEGEVERALFFWRCLSVAQLGKSIPEKLLHDARRRMKRLCPELHGEYMGERPAVEAP